MWRCSDRLRFGLAAAIVCGFGVLAAPLAAAQSSFEEKGRAFCYDVEKMLNALVDYTRTACVPTKGAGGQHSFILISEQPVFSVEASKRGWIVGVVGVTGLVLNRNPSLKVDQLALSDVNQMKARTAYFMQASLAASLQRRAKADQITLDALYAEALRGLKRQAIPETRQAR